MVSQESAEISARSDHPFIRTLTTQVKPARNVFMEAAMTKVFGDLGNVGITQVVSDSGVENWAFGRPAQAVYREGVTSVNFTADVIDGFVRGRLMLNFWSEGGKALESMTREEENSDLISTICVVYDERDGRAVHVHEFVGDGTGLFGKDGEEERSRMALQMARQHTDSSHLQTLDAPSDFRIEPEKVYRVEPSTRKLVPRVPKRPQVPEPPPQWADFLRELASGGGSVDPNALVQSVLRESYLQTTEDLRSYAEKVKYYNQVKKHVRAYLGALRDFHAAVCRSARERGIDIRRADEDDRSRLAEIFLEHTRPYDARDVACELSIPDRIPAEGVSDFEQLEAEIKRREEELNSIGDDAQLANVDLQNMLQKQQQTLQMMSNISKMLHDTAMSVIRKMGG